MSGKLLLKVTSNARNNIVRQIALDSSKCAKRDVIAVDVYDDVPDVATHTGQKFEIGDKRRARFSNHTRYVNPNIAIDLIAKVPPIASKERVVWCDGGDPHLGHPKVYINLDKPGNHSCSYCGLRFYKEDSHHH